MEFPVRVKRNRFPQFFNKIANSNSEGYSNIEFENYERTVLVS